MYIKLPIEPIACPRPKVTKWGTYYPKKYMDWKKEIAVLLAPLPLIDSNQVSINLKFIMKRPKARFRKKDLDQRYPHIKKPDIDNLIKSVFDAIQSNNILKDDSHIWRVSAEKWVADKTEQPSIILQIKREETIGLLSTLNIQ